MIRAIIVHDEPLARARLRTLLSQADTPVELVGEASSGEEAVALVHEFRPDLLFLDIQMPVLDGFDVVDLLTPPRPQIIFVTAYDQHALRAFEVHALDYLTKPVRLARLNQTLARLPKASNPDPGIEHLLRQRSGDPLLRLTVHVGRRLRVVPLEEIRWIEAEEKIVLVHLLDGGSCLTDFTLDELEMRLDPSRFLRIHRSSIVNAGRVKELAPWFAGSYIVKLDDGTQLPVARRRVRQVRTLLGGT
jgi:two-component system LytT family response regulator